MITDELELMDSKISTGTIDSFLDFLYGIIFLKLLVNKGLRHFFHDTNITKIFAISVSGIGIFFPSN